MKNFTIIISFTILMLSCTPPEPIIIEVPVEKKDNLSLGKVQSQIKKGMNQTEVLEVLGSPNIVTKNSNGDEVWTYDRIGTFQSQSVKLNLGEGFGLSCLAEPPILSNQIQIEILSQNH